MFKKILLLIVLGGIIYLCINPIVFLPEEPANKIYPSFTKGDTVTIQQLAGEAGGNFASYIILADHEKENLPPEIKRSRVLKTTDPKVINELLNLKFRITGGDAATIESRLILYSAGGIVFSTAVSLEPAFGIQNEATGWAVPDDHEQFVNLCEKFERYYLPVLILQ